MIVNQESFVRITKMSQFLLGPGVVLVHVRDEVHAHDYVLTGRDEGATVGGAEDIVRGHHQHMSFCLSFN